MSFRAGGNSPELSALLIAPDRSLADQFTASQAESHCLQIVSELKAYPSRHILEVRLRQIRPDVIVLDVSSDPSAAAEVIEFAVGLSTPIEVLAISPRNDSEILMECLRLGVGDFLYAPFDAKTQREVVSRLRRLRNPVPEILVEPGTLVVFSSTKPGSGASTLVTQTALALRQRTGKSVLLMDFDLTGGSIGFNSKTNHHSSLLDALENADRLTVPVWSALVSEIDGVDVLTAPDVPYTGPIDHDRLVAVLEFVRKNYAFVLIDLPVIFQRFSLTVLSNADRALLISTTELPSLHLARKAVQLLNQIGFPKERFQILLNRVNRRDEIARSDVDKLINCKVFAKFPNDFFSLQRFVTLGKALDPECELGKAVGALAAQIAANAIQPVEGAA